jgi:hypothetical protein
LPDATFARGESTVSPLGSRRGTTRVGRLGRTIAAALALILVALSLASRVAGAQQRDTTRATRRDTTRAAPRTPADTGAAARRDSARVAGPRSRPRRAATTAAVPDSLVRPPISPRRAFLYSLVVPGQGQTALHRQKAAALFATIELGTVAMIFKSRNDLRIARARIRDSVVTDSVAKPDGGFTYTKVPDRLVARIKARRLHVEDWMATLLFNHLFSGADAFVAAQLWDLPTQVSFQPAARGAALKVSVSW